MRGVRRAATAARQGTGRQCNRHHARYFKPRHQHAPAEGARHCPPQPPAATCARHAPAHACAAAAHLRHQPAAAHVTYVDCARTGEHTPARPAGAAHAAAVRHSSGGGSDSSSTQPYTHLQAPRAPHAGATTPQASPWHCDGPQSRCPATASGPFWGSIAVYDGWCVVGCVCVLRCAS
jgi:hypothetical protein